MGTRPTRFRPPAPKTGPRRFKPTPDTDPIRANLIRITALRGRDTVAFERECRKFVTENMGLAWEYCASLNVRHVPLEDLVQSASIGLLEAIRRFDPAKAGKFSTYAIWWLKHHVNAYLVKQETLVQAPQDLLAIRREIDWLERDGKPRSDDEVEEHLLKKRDKEGRPRWRNVPAGRIAEARELYLGHSHKAVDHRRMAQHRDELDQETRQALLQAIQQLPPRLRAVIADEFGVAIPGAQLPADPTTREHLRALALRKLRASISV